MWIHYDLDGIKKMLNLDQVSKFETDDNLIVFFGQPGIDPEDSQTGEIVIEEFTFSDNKDAKECFNAIIDSLAASKKVVMIEVKFKGFNPDIFIGNMN